MDLAVSPVTTATAREGESRGAPILALWIGLTLLLNAAMWATGGRTAALTTAVEGGVARIERDAADAPSDEAVRKAVELQRAALPFWAVVRMLGDFLFEPTTLAIRAAATAVGFCACAALAGRPWKFGRAWADGARLQGWWVLGLAVRMGLATWLRRGEEDVETSLALLLPPGSYPAAVALAARRVDAFALLGWLAIARAGRRRGEANLATALALCGSLAAVEAAVRVAVGLFVGSATRLALTAP